MPSSVVTYFLPWLCAWGGCIVISCQFHIYPRIVGFCFFYCCAVLWCVQIIIAQWSYFLLALYTTLLSSLCRRIWRYWTSKILVRYILLSVCLRLNQFSRLSFMQYMGLCVFSLPISLMMIVRICKIYHIIIVESEVWPNCHCLGLGHETKVCTVCLSIFLWGLFFSSQVSITKFQFIKGHYNTSGFEEM